MKFSLFAHPERYGDEPYDRLLNDLTDLVILAEQSGFDGFWIGEHYGMDFTASPNPLVLLAHLAARTSTIRLVTGNVIAPFWHPIRLASEAAMVDQLSGGRLELGVARGAYQFEFDRLVPGVGARDGGGAYMRELVPLLRQLWKGDAESDGLWKFPATTSVPKPATAAGPPIWIAAREAASHEFAVSHGCNVCCTPLSRDDTEVEELVEKFEDAVAANPQVHRPRLMMLRHACVVESDDQVNEAAEAVRGWYAQFERWVRNDGTVSVGQAPPVPVSELTEKPIYDLDAVKHSALVGTPATIRDRLQHYQRLGIDEVGFWTDFPGGHALKLRSVELLATEVLSDFVGAPASVAS